MHSMSGSAGGDHGGQLLFTRSDQPARPTVGFASSFDDMGSMFLSSSQSSARDSGDGTPPAYDNSSITDYLQGFLDYPAGLVSQLDAHPPPTDDAVKPGSSAVMPNSSSTSSDAHAPAAEEEVDEGASAHHQKCRSSSKKKGVEKKARGSRVAFATKSEVDHLDDGYRWRKYGQKAVKNSSYPRSYYRCTAARCGVKKQVERSQQDPSTVITTYEGHHQHPSPITCRLQPPLTMLAAYHSSLASAAAQQRQLLQHGFSSMAAPPAPIDGPQDLLLPGFVMASQQHGQT